MNAVQYIDRLFETERLEVMKLQDYWLDRDGVLHPVLGHQSGAVELRPDLFKGRLPGGVSSTPRASEIIYGAMYANGYARVYVDGWTAPGNVFVYKEGQLNTIQLRVLKDLAIEKDFNLELDRGQRSQVVYKSTGRDLKESAREQGFRRLPGAVTAPGPGMKIKREAAHFRISNRKDLYTQEDHPDTYPFYFVCNAHIEPLYRGKGLYRRFLRAFAQETGPIRSDINGHTEDAAHEAWRGVGAKRVEPNGQWELKIGESIDRMFEAIFTGTGWMNSKGEFFPVTNNETHADAAMYMFPEMFDEIMVEYPEPEDQEQRRDAMIELMMDNGWQRIVWDGGDGYKDKTLYAEGGRLSREQKDALITHAIEGSYKLMHCLLGKGATELYKPPVTEAIDRIFESTPSWMAVLPKSEDSPQFVRWFGRSCVVRSNSPLLVYHGTDSEFDRFDFAHVRNPGEGGPFFTDDLYIAQDYGGRIVEAYLSIEKPYVLHYDKWLEGGLSVRSLITSGYDGFVIEEFNSGGKDGDVDGDSADIGTVYVPFVSHNQIMIVG